MSSLHSSPTDLQKRPGRGLQALSRVFFCQTELPVSLAQVTAKTILQALKDVKLQKVHTEKESYWEAGLLHDASRCEVGLCQVPTGYDESELNMAD